MSLIRRSVDQLGKIVNIWLGLSVSWPRWWPGTVTARQLLDNLSFLSVSHPHQRWSFRHLFIEVLRNIWFAFNNEQFQSELYQCMKKIVNVTKHDKLICLSQCHDVTHIRDNVMRTVWSWHNYYLNCGLITTLLLDDGHDNSFVVIQVTVQIHENISCGSWNWKEDFLIILFTFLWSKKEFPNSWQWTYGHENVGVVGAT